MQQKFYKRTSLTEGDNSEYSKYSNNELANAIIKLSRFEGNAADKADLIGMKAELKKRKNQPKKIKETMKKTSLKALIKECYKEVLAENEEMDLPADTGKNINMGFDNNIGLDVDKRMSKNMSEVMGKIEMLKNKLAPFIADFKAKKLSRQQYEEATIGLRASIAAAKADLEKMIAKL